MTQKTNITPRNMEIKEQIRAKLQCAEELERTYEPYDKIFTEIEQLLHFIDPNQKDTLEYSTQNSEDEKVSFLGKMATIYELIGDYRDAMKFYQELDDIVPGHAKILKGLGDCLRNQGKDTEAIEKYEEALDNYFYDEKLDATILHCKALSHIELSYNKLDSESRREELSSARKDLEKAVEYDPENALYLVSLGKVLDLQRETEEAFERFQKAEDLIRVGKVGHGLEAADGQYFEELLPQLIEFKTTMKAIKYILSEKMKSVQDPSDKDLEEWMLQKNLEANDVLNLESFKAEYRERIFRYAKTDKESNLKLFRTLFDQIVSEQKAVIKQKENELAEKVKGFENAEEDLKTLKKFFLKKELRTELSQWKKKIYQERREEDQRKKLIEYFEGFSRTLESVYVASLVIQSDEVKDYPSLITELSIPALVSSLIWSPDQDTEKISSIPEFLRCEVIQILSSSLLNLGNETQFAHYIGEAIYDIIKDSAYKKKIYKIREEDLKEFSEGVQKKMLPFAERFPKEINDKLYEKFYNAPAAKFGNKDAIFLVEKWLKGERKEDKISEEWKNQVVT